MPVSSIGNIIRNVTLLCAEGLAAGMVVLIGAACASLLALPAFAPAIGYGIAALVFTALLVLRTGAMLNTGAVLLKVAMWMFGLDSRQYFTHVHWIVLSGGSDSAAVPRLMPWQWLVDIIMGALYMGFQIGGALLGVLLLRDVDRSDFLDNSVHTKPYANLAGEDARAFLLAYVLNAFVLTVYGAMTSNNFNAKARQMLAPFIVGLAVFLAVFVSHVYGVGTVISFPSDLALAIIVPSSRTRLWIGVVAAVGGALTAFMFCWWMDFLDRQFVHEMHTKPHWKASRRSRKHHTHRAVHRVHPSFDPEVGRLILSLSSPISAGDADDNGVAAALQATEDARL